MARYYQKPEDQIILEEIKAVIAIRATYGYRRVTTMVNRQRAHESRKKINRKRVQRIMHRMLIKGISYRHPKPLKVLKFLLPMIL